MIILDTNVISELMRATPTPAVIAWIDAQSPEAVWTTTINVFEVRFGLAILPAGSRRDKLSAAFETALRQDLGDRVLELGSAAAHAAMIAAKLRAVGRSIDFRDVLIAGVAAVHNATLATHNIRHFADTGIELIDPWAVSSSIE